jgi:hypothetical protein
MDRKSFTQRLALLGIYPVMINDLSASTPSIPQDDQDEKLKAITSQKEFVQNWLSDLLESDAFAEEKLLTMRAFGADLEIIQSEDADNTARKLARMEGIFGGTTSGANVWAAIQRARIIGSGRKILTIICDSGLKYLDGDLFRW